MQEFLYEEYAELEPSVIGDESDRREIYVQLKEKDPVFREFIASEVQKLEYVKMMEKLDSIDSKIGKQTANREGKPIDLKEAAAYIQKKFGNYIKHRFSRDM